MLRCAVTLHSTPSISLDTGYVNGLRLLRLVRLRREFRALGTVSLVGLPVWFGLVVAVQGLTPTGSPAWDLADSAAAPGFAVLGGLLVLSIVALLVLRFATGRIGRVAAAFAPAVVRGAEPDVADHGDALRGLLPRLRKKRLVSLGLILSFLAFTAVAIATSLNVGPAYAANHGHGGTVVTIGDDATISRVETGSHGHKDYFLATPDGEAIAEDSKPEDGQRWVVLDREAGNDEAYLIGGHDYLLIGFIAIAATIADAYLIIAMCTSVRRERRLRMAGGHVPLAYSVRRLAAGARPTVRFAKGGSATIGLPALHEDSDAAAQALVRRRRRNATIVIAAVVVVLAGTGIGLKLSIKPTQRDVTLPYLATGFWSADVSADYTDGDNAEHNVAVDMLEAGGVGGTPDVGSVWLVVAQARTSDPVTEVDDAFIDVADIGSVPARTAVAGGVAFQRQVASGEHGEPVAVPGLPPGWAGVLTSDDAQQRTVDVFGSADGSLVDIEIDGKATGAYLGDRARELAATIARRGIGRFADDTAP